MAANEQNSSAAGTIARSDLGDLWDRLRASREVQGIARGLVQRAVLEATGPETDFFLGESPETWSPLADARFESAESLARQVGLYGAMASEVGPRPDDMQADPQLEIGAVVVDEAPGLTFAVDGNRVAVAAIENEAFLLPIPGSAHSVGIEVEPRPETLIELETLAQASTDELVVWRIYAGENSWVRDVITTARDGVHHLTLAGLEAGAFAVGRVVRTRSKALDADRPDPFQRYRLTKAEAKNPAPAKAVPRLGDGRAVDRAIVVVHGTMSNGLALAQAVLDASGNAVEVRRYEHDTWLSLETNAAELATLLSDQVAENVSLVAHSRGGLVAARAMTLLARDGGPAVTSLTTLGTPFSGTPVAASADLAFLGVRALMGGLRYAGGPTVDAATRLAGFALRLRTPPGLRLMYPNNSALPLLRDALRPDTITFAAEAGGGVGSHRGPGLARSLGKGAFGDVANDLVVAVESAQALPGPPVLQCDHFSYLDSPEVRRSLDFRAPGTSDAAAEPPLVAAARRRAEELGFTCASDPVAGRLLAALAAAVPPGGRILELGSGTGVGTAWLVVGLDPRDDVEVATVEADAQLAAVVRDVGFPPYVRPVEGDAVALLPQLGDFDLIFADAEGGKWVGLDLTIAALRPGGVLVVDDMDLARYSDASYREQTMRVRDRLVEDTGLVTVELDAGSGFVLATRRHVAG